VCRRERTARGSGRVRRPAIRAPIRGLD